MSTKGGTRGWSRPHIHQGWKVRGMRLLDNSKDEVCCHRRRELTEGLLGHGLQAMGRLDRSWAMLWVLRQKGLLREIFLMCRKQRLQRVQLLKLLHGGCWSGTISRNWSMSQKSNKIPLQISLSNMRSRFSGVPLCVPIF